MKLIAAGIEGIDTPLRFNNPNTLVGDLVSTVLVWLIAFSGFIFFGRLIMAGFNLMTAGGDSGKISSAQKSISHATIGLIGTISAFFIAQIIETVLGLNIL